MEKYFSVSVQGDYFTFFYNLAFFTALLFVLFEGYRRNFPMLRWALFLMFCRILFITGTKVMTYTSAEWGMLASTLTLPEAPGKSLLGGLLFGCIALISGKYIFGLKQNYPDAFALALPVAIGIQRLGCFFTGCCFGRPAVLPWAVQYPVYTPAHYHQFHSGMISTQDLVSLTVHPVQLYELAGTLLVVVSLILLRNHFRAKGSFLLFSLTMLLTVRIIAEFFRDPLAHTIGGEMIWLLNTTQWLLLPVILLSGLMIIYRERNVAMHKPVDETEISSGKAFVSMVIISLIVSLLRNWFSYPEMLALTMVVLVTIGLMLRVFLAGLRGSPYRIFYLATSVLPLMLMSQTPPNGGADTLMVRIYRSIQAGYTHGTLSNSHTTVSGSGCDTSSQTEYFNHDYTVFGLGYEQTTVKPAEHLTLSKGVRTYFGVHTETRLSNAQVKNHKIIGVSPYVRYDWKWAGIGTGLNIGSNRYITENISEDGTHQPRSGSGFIPAYPQLYLRLLPQKYIFIDYRAADNFPSALPGYRNMIGIGSGLGMENGTILRFGTTFLHWYAEGYFPLGDKIVFQPLVTWGKDFPTRKKTEFQVAFSLAWRFDHRDKHINGL